MARKKKEAGVIAKSVVFALAVTKKNVRPLTQDNRNIILPLGREGEVGIPAILGIPVLVETYRNLEEARKAKIDQVNKIFDSAKRAWGEDA